MSVPGRHRTGGASDESTGSPLLLALAVQSVAEDLDPDGIVERAVELSCAVTGAEHAVLALTGGPGGSDRPRQVVTHGDPGQLEGAHTLALPLLVDGGLFGTLHLGGRERPFAGRDVHSVTLLLRAAGAALTQSRERVAYAAGRMAEDRDRIAADLRELVEEPLQAAAGELRHVLAGEQDARDRVEAALRGVELAARDVRAAVFELRQGVDTPVDALRALVAELAGVLGFRPTVRVSGSAALLHDELADHVLAVVREALVNVARHARATSATVELDASPAWLMLTITDDGVGPDANRAEGAGLGDLAARARTLGGVLRLTSASPRGARLDWLVPVRRRRPVGRAADEPACPTG